MLALMLRFATSPPQRPGALRMIISSAATLEPPTWEGALARYQVPVVNVYGLTETVCGSLYAGPDPASLRVGTVGAADDCEIRLVGPDGQPAAPGEPGRLWVRGAHLLRGYHRDPAATAEVLRDGWFDTGDLASLEPDGLYRLRGRSKQIIITGGYNVSPDEVTAALVTHPAVQEAATLGCPEPTWGEVVVAFVVTARPGVGADELLRHCRERLAPHKVPARIELVDALPRHGPAGKVRFDELRARLAPASEAAAPAGPDVQGTVFALAARCFRVRMADLTPDQGPEQLGGWTSLAHLGLVAALERSFGIRLEPRDVMAIKDLRAAVAVVSRKLQARDLGSPPA
jgi:long-chain acyl-CoA synthetase